MLQLARSLVVVWTVLVNAAPTDATRPDVEGAAADGAAACLPGGCARSGKSEMSEAQGKLFALNFAVQVRATGLNDTT